MAFDCTYELKPKKKNEPKNNNGSRKRKTITYPPNIKTTKHINMMMASEKKEHIRALQNINVL